MELHSILDLVTDLVSRKNVTKSRRVTKSMYTVNPNPYRGGRTGNLLCINPLLIDYFCVIQLTSYPKTNIESYFLKVYSDFFRNFFKKKFYQVA